MGTARQLRSKGVRAAATALCLVLEHRARFTLCLSHDDSNPTPSVIVYVTVRPNVEALSLTLGEGGTILLNT